MSDCIFCKIAAKEIPSEFLYEDDNCVVFRDIHPKAKTHLLIVSKKHIHSIAEMESGDEVIVGHLFNVAKKIAADLGLSGYNLQINVGKEGGQEVFHLHVHVIPMKPNEGFTHGKAFRDFTNPRVCTELQKDAEKIMQHLTKD